MTSLLITGAGLLALGLVATLAGQPPPTGSTSGQVAVGWLGAVATYVGAGLVVAALVLRALHAERARAAPPERGRDWYAGG
jgi:VIT1/CCC1 family predicted Fe2+/Mn2+ transporter